MLVAIASVDRNQNSKPSIGQWGDAELYGKRVTNQEVLLGGAVKPPASAAPLIATLDRFSGQEGQRARPAEKK